MKVESSESIILRHRDFRERDRLVTFLTRDKGKLTGIAKGVKVITGRGVGVYESFTRGNIFYVSSRSSDLVAIRKCDPIPPYLQLQADYDVFLHASYVTELVELCSDRTEDAEPLFDLLATVLAHLAETTPGGLPLLRLDFELNLLRVLGLQPQWRNCLDCGKAVFERREGRLAPRRALVHRFNPAKGGIICPDCRGGGAGRIELSPGTLAFFAAWRESVAAGNPLGELGAGVDARAVAELERALEAHIQHHVERKPRSLALLPPPGGAGEPRPR